MPTPKDGVVKTDSETYPGTLAGRTQFANRTHFDRICSTQRLDEVHHDPTKQHKKSGVEEQPTPQMFAEYLQDIFALEIPTSNLQLCIGNGDEGASVPLFPHG